MIIYHLSLINYYIYQLSIINYHLSLIIYYLSIINYYLLFIAHRSSPTPALPLRLLAFDDFDHLVDFHRQLFQHFLHFLV